MTAGGKLRPTSSLVIFLVEKQGVFQLVRPAMEYHAVEDTDPNQNTADHQVCPAGLGSLQASIKRLLAE